MSTVYERLGGDAAVETAVDLLYDKLLADERINSFFKDMNMTMLRRKQVLFMRMAFGGPNEYTGADLYTVHKRLMQEKGLNQSHFDVVAENFVAVMNELSVPEDLQQQCLAIIGPTREYFALKEEDKPAPKASIFDKIGGLPAVTAAVDLFYAKLLVDNRVKHFFLNIPIEKLKAKQVQFMQYAFGGPEAYTGRDLYAAHRDLMLKHGLNQGHFDVIVENFIAVLNELKVPQDVQNECLAVLGPARDIFKLKEEDAALVPTTKSRLIRIDYVEVGGVFHSKK